MRPPLDPEHHGKAPRLIMRVPPATVHRLDHLAEQRGVGRSVLLREAIDRLLAAEAVA